MNQLREAKAFFFVRVEYYSYNEEIKFRRMIIMKKIISNISEFSQGFKMGVQLQAEAINVPMWLSWMLSVLLIPLNLVIVAVLF